MREENNNSLYTAEISEANSYVRKKPGYDKDLLWRNRVKYLGHKRAVGYLFTSDIVLGIVAALVVKGNLAGISNNPAGAFSLVLILGVIVSSVITVTCLENKKVIKIAMIIFAVCGVLLFLLFRSLLYLIFFYFYAAQMFISLILAKNLDYLKTQFGYPYFSEAIVENQIYRDNKSKQKSDEKYSDKKYY